MTVKVAEVQGGASLEQGTYIAFRIFNLAQFGNHIAIQFGIPSFVLLDCLLQPPVPHLHIPDRKNGLLVMCISIQDEFLHQNKLCKS